MAFTKIPSAPPFEQRAPWFGPDLQTLRNMLRGGVAELGGGDRLLLRMPDGDRLSARLDCPSYVTAKPLIVLVHGLTGCETSLAVVGSARHLVAKGWPVLRLNLRGSRMSRATSAGRYHAGKTEDLAEALRQLPSALSQRGVVLLGHSLGGNLVLKFMGEGEHGAPILAAVAVSTPIDLAASCVRMMSGRNFVYHRHLLAAMKSEALEPGAALEASERAAIAAARSIFEFDDRFVAPHFGFRGAQEYYAVNSAQRFLAAIKTPTLLVHALDDPWIPAESYEAIDWPRLGAIETALSSGGGHLGFHGHGSDVPWHDRMTAWWLTRRLFPHEEV